MILRSVPRLKVYSFLLSMPIIDIAINQIMYGERLWTIVSADLCAGRYFLLYAHQCLCESRT
jgi:hypothetical protein